MVVHKGISLTLHSPESLNTLVPNALEEFLLPTSSDHGHHQHSHTAMRYVPVLPGSSFWLSYRVLVPPPPGLETKLYVFKLFIGQAHFSTWSVDGESEKPSRRWKGRCMFGLFEDPTVVDPTNGGKKVFQKRGFAFEPPPNNKPGNKMTKTHKRQDSKDSDSASNEKRKLQKKRRSDELAHPFTPPKSWAKTAATGVNERYIEIRVYRAKGKKRIPRDVPPFDAKAFETVSGRGLDLKHAGYATKTHPRRYYEFDLLDPKDEPYATFKFYYGTMKELKALGIELGGDDTPTRQTCPERPEAAVPASTDKGMVVAKESRSSLRQKLEQARASQHQHDAVKAVEDESTPPSTPVKSNDPGVGAVGPSSDRMADSRRLSIPPSIKLFPSLGSWRRNPTYGAPEAEIDKAVKRRDGLGLQSKSSVESLKKRGGHGLWRAFHEEREAEHGGY